MSGTYPTDPAFQAVNFRSVFNSVHSDAISGRRQSRHLGGHRFEFGVKYRNLTSAEFLPVFAFVASQKNSVDIFTVTLPVLSSASGDASGTVLVNGAHSIGDSTIALDGLTGTLKAGNFIKFANHSKVYMITADLTGAGTLSIQPPIMAALADNEAITFDDVPFTAKIDGDAQKFSLPMYDRYNYEIDMIEAV